MQVYSIHYWPTKPEPTTSWAWQQSPLRRETATTTAQYFRREEAPRVPTPPGTKSEQDAFLAYAYFVLDQQEKYCQE